MPRAPLLLPRICDAKAVEHLDLGVHRAQAAAGQVHALLPGGMVGTSPGKGPSASPLAAAENLRFIHAWNEQRAALLLQRARQAPEASGPVALADTAVLAPNHFLGVSDDVWRATMLGARRSRDSRLARCVARQRLPQAVRPLEHTCLS